MSQSFSASSSSIPTILNDISQSVIIINRLPKEFSGAIVVALRSNGEELPATALNSKNLPMFYKGPVVPYVFDTYDADILRIVGFIGGNVKCAEYTLNRKKETVQTQTFKVTAKVSCDPSEALVGIKKVKSPFPTQDVDTVVCLARKALLKHCKCVKAEC